jgi:hypothetical protein
MKKLLAFPSLFYLIITLISGMWIRLQWLLPEWALFTQKFAINAHSHLAMLGWLFPAFLYFLMKSPKLPTFSQKVSIGFMHILIIAMFPAFLLEGYAFYSILFSSLFLVVSYFLLWQFRVELELQTNPLKQWAVGLYVLSTIGPWALGGATAFGPAWLSAWIAWFLHLQFNGWVTFAVFAIFWSAESLAKQQIISIHAMGISTIFLSLGMMFPKPDTLVGFSTLTSGTILFISAVHLLLRHNPFKDRSTIGHFLITLLLMKSMFISGIGLDLVQTYVHQVSQARVAFTHSTLLGIATPFLLFHLKLSRIYLLGFITVAWWMIFFLWIETFGLYRTLGFPFSLQIVYLILGFLLLMLILIGFFDFRNNSHATKTYKTVFLPS